jgi:hypothetical protein
MASSQSKNRMLQLGSEPRRSAGIPVCFASAEEDIVSSGKQQGEAKRQKTERKTSTKTKTKTKNKWGVGGLRPGVPAHCGSSGKIANNEC